MKRLVMIAVAAVLASPRPRRAGACTRSDDLPG